LYSVLLRYGQSSGCRMPSRATLAGRLHKGSKDTVDRALKELQAVGAVVVQRRRRDGRNLTNRYLLMSTAPIARATSPAAESASGDGRIFAATPGRTDAATLAADLRPDPEFLTENPPPAPPPAAVPSAASTATGRPTRHVSCAPSTCCADPAGLSRRGVGGVESAVPGGDAGLLAACGISDLRVLADDCQATRRRLGLPAARWSTSRLLPVIAQAAKVGGWPPQLIGPALRALAADPATRSPMRLPYPGPWWDTAETAGHSLADRAAQAGEQQTLEARLAEADGSRVWAQQQARSQLAERGEPVTRLAVARLACQLLDDAELT